MLGFKRKCKCGERAMFWEVLENLHERKKFLYCKVCWDAKENERLQKYNEFAMREQKRLETKRKKERLEYLKLEVELIEYEEKARLLGIGSDQNAEHELVVKNESQTEVE